MSTARRKNHLTVNDFCEELDIARSTFDEWRAKGRAPRCLKLPNGRILIRISDYEAWLESCVEAAA